MAVPVVDNMRDGRFARPARNEDDLCSRRLMPRFAFHQIASTATFADFSRRFSLKQGVEMPPQLVAVGLLVGYALAGCALIVRQVVRSGVGWQAWFLYCLERIYCGLWFRWRSNRRCPFPKNGAAIVIANHTGPVDPLLIWMNHHFGRDDGRLRTLGFLMAREYYNLPVLHWVGNVTRSIPLDRHGADMAPVRQAYRQLEAGELIGIFPEGGINLGTQLCEADTGVAWLALKARVPVYPVFIKGSPRGESMVEPFFRRARVRVLFGDAIDLSEYYGRRKSHDVLQEVTDLLMTRLAKLGNTTYARRADTEPRTLTIGTKPAV